MARTDSQKSLTNRIFKTLSAHLTEWDVVTFDEVLQVLGDVTEAIRTQKRISTSDTFPRKKGS